MSIGPGLGSAANHDEEALTRAALAYVCENFAELRQDLFEAVPESNGAVPALLENLTTALQISRPIVPALEDIDGALLRAGDHRGLYGRFDASYAGRGLSDLTIEGVQVRPPVADEVVYLCPSGQCTRSSWPAAGPVERCTLTGQGFREDRL